MIKANPKFSQNFLSSKEWSGRFRQAVEGKERKGVAANALVIEIGCGSGAITRELLKTRARKVIGIEVDTQFEGGMNGLKAMKESNPGRFDYVMGDALDSSLLEGKIKEALEQSPSPPETVHLVGNLPFSIAGPLLYGWNKQSLLRTGIFSHNVEATLIFAAGMGERLLPTFNKRTRFSTVTQTAFDVTHMDTFPSSAFTPKPSTDAIILRLTNRKESLFQDERELEHYLRLLKQVYILPNKQAGNACRSIPNSKDLLYLAGINSTDRIFTVPIARLIKFSKLVLESNEELPSLIGTSEKKKRKERPPPLFN